VQTQKSLLKLETWFTLRMRLRMSGASEISRSIEGWLLGMWGDPIDFEQFDESELRDVLAQHLTDADYEKNEPTLRQHLSNVLPRISLRCFHGTRRLDSEVEIISREGLPNRNGLCCLLSDLPSDRIGRAN
jgi:hypothetical protein